MLHTPPVSISEIISSPVGFLEISSSEAGITRVHFSDRPAKAGEASMYADACARQLEEYFSGQRKVFDLPLDLQGTDFQKRVWTELLNIPYGKTISYLELARRLGDEKVIRAAGMANGKNPVGIIVPCHRVIGSNGELVGYAGGLHRKKWLLELESGYSQTSLF